MGDRTGPASQARSIDELYREHRLELVRLAVLLLGDRAAAEDVVQDVFMSLWRRRFSPGLSAYLRTAVVNRCRSSLRRIVVARRYRPPDDRPDAGPEDRFELAEEHRSVIAAIGRLPRRQREVIVLRYYSQLPVAEVAATLGIGEGTVKSTSARALARLRDAMEESA